MDGPRAPVPIFLDTNFRLSRVSRRSREKLNETEVGRVARGSAEGVRSATGGEAGALAEVKRCSVGHKREVVLRLLRGAPLDGVSREVAVPIYELEPDYQRGSAVEPVGCRYWNRRVNRGTDDATESHTESH